MGAPEAGAQRPSVDAARSVPSLRTDSHTARSCVDRSQWRKACRNLLDLQVACAVRVGRRRCTALVFDDRRRHERAGRSECGTPGSEIGVLVVEEEALVEPARLTEEVRRQHHCAAREEVDHRRGSDDDVQRAVTDVGAGAVVPDRDTQTVDAGGLLPAISSFG